MPDDVPGIVGGEEGTVDGEDDGDGAGDADGGDVDRGDGTLLGLCKVDGKVDGEIDRLMIPTIGVTRREEGATDGVVLSTIGVIVELSCPFFFAIFPFVLYLPLDLPFDLLPLLPLLSLLPFLSFSAGR